MKKVNNTVELLNERIKKVVNQPLYETPTLYVTLSFILELWNASDGTVAKRWILHD